MASTIYASFNDVDQAEKAAGALLDHGVLKEDLSLVASGTNRQVQEQEINNPLPVSARYAPATGVQGVGTVPTYPVGVSPTAYQDEGTIGTSSTSGRFDTTPYNASVTSPYGTNAVPDGTADIDNTQANSVAKSGITTTTAEDAGVGAVKGTGIGLGLGILAGLAALTVPGVGLVLGGGALAAAVGAAASTTVAGAAVGGVVGYLKDQGIAETDAVRYQQAIGMGGALLAVSLPSNNIGLDEAEQVLNKYGATDISSY
jgi:hypothetical protein